MSGKSDFLFAQPSLWEGMGRLVDFGDFLTEYNRSLTSAQADAIATAMDWQAIYDDLWTAFEDYRQSVDTQPREEHLTVGATT